VRIHALEQVGDRRRTFYDFTWVDGRWCWIFPDRIHLDPDLLKRDRS